MRKPITTTSVHNQVSETATFLRYLEQLATNDDLRGAPVDASQLWALYDEAVRNGTSFEAVADALSLPQPASW